jgi:ArsR family transcriptional regulator, nickel/cobalt-responsive transcriptional repressor
MRDRLQSDKCARFLKALADPDRLKIVQCLQDGPKNVTDLATALGKEMANVSHHLKVLRHAGLVQDEKGGRFYQLHPEVFRPKQSGAAMNLLDLGCCRLELND